jgi:predicted PurR-regulated permease PerM
MKVTEYSKMAKTKKSGKKEKKRISSRDIIAGLIVIVALLLVLALVVWLIMPMAGQRAVPRKSRGLQQSWLEWPVNAVQIELIVGIKEANLLNDPQEVSSQNGRRKNNGPS